MSMNRRVTNGASEDVWPLVIFAVRTTHIVPPLASETQVHQVEALGPRGVWRAEKKVLRLHVAVNKSLG
eukprot:scaffold274910_cov46-Prasinocladus_malaysianus.AAC.1